VASLGLSPVGLGNKNHCAGEDQQQKTVIQSVSMLKLAVGREYEEVAAMIRVVTCEMVASRQKREQRGPLTGNDW
jgi:hypothetical protein